MDAPRFRDLREFGTETFMAVGPCRIAFSTLCLIGSSDIEAHQKELLAKQARGRVNSAERWLGALFGEGINDLGVEEPDNLKQKRQRAYQAIAPMAVALRKCDHDLEETMVLADTFKGHCLSRVEPDVTEFLSHMTKYLNNVQADRDGERQKAILDVLTSARFVGRTIGMISINASIEAARAGEYGKSFEGIASEVRSLARQTQDLLTEVSALLLEDSRTDGE